MIIPIDSTVTVRKTLWVVVCPSCQWERIVTYCQAYNVRKQKCSEKCKSCLIEAGELNLNKKGLEIGRSKENQEKAVLARTGVTSPGRSKAITIRNTFLGNPAQRTDVKEKFRKAKLGKYGPLASRWKGGFTNPRKLEMRRDPYISWRKQVFQRDNYTCQFCKGRGGKLEADHIKEWSNYPESRYDLSNGRTLCKSCHKNTPNYGNKAKKFVREKN